MQGVTPPLLADAARLDHFRSLGEFTRDGVPFHVTRRHHIRKSKEIPAIRKLKTHATKGSTDRGTNPYRSSFDGFSILNSEVSKEAGD